MQKLLCVGLLAASVVVGRAELYYFDIDLGGPYEVPPNASPASGFGTATYDSVAGTIALSVSFTGLLAPATASHIHDGAAGVNGPVIVSFVPYTPATTSGTITGTGLAFPLANVADLLAGDTYFNIHTSVFPGGEIRGQLMLVPEPATLALAGLGLGSLLLGKRRK